MSSIKLNSVINPKLNEIVRRTVKIAEIIKSQSQTNVLTVAIFDIVDSTSGKINEGHDHITKKVIVFNEICNVIIKKYQGEIIKYMGDGCLAKFRDPLSACIAAINIRYFSSTYEIDSKAILTLGMVEEIKISDRQDVLGSSVDRCFRIEKITQPNKTIIDEALYKITLTFLRKFHEIDVSDSITVDLKGFGAESVHEINFLEKQLD